MEEKNLRIDSDWKTRAQQEKAQLAGQAQPARKTESKAAPGKPAAPLRPGERTPFMQFIQGLATEVLMCLGAVAHPQTGQAFFEPEQAKATIDLLHLLEEKTRGNLIREEEQFLQDVLHELRVTFVELSKRAAAASPPGKPAKR